MEANTHSALNNCANINSLNKLVSEDLKVTGSWSDNGRFSIAGSDDKISLADIRKKLLDIVNKQKATVKTGDILTAQEMITKLSGQVSLVSRLAHVFVAIFNGNYSVSKGADAKIGQVLQNKWSVQDANRKILKGGCSLHRLSGLYTEWRPTIFQTVSKKIRDQQDSQNLRKAVKKWAEKKFGTNTKEGNESQPKVDLDQEQTKLSQITEDLPAAIKRYDLEKNKYFIYAEEKGSGPQLYILSYIDSTGELQEITKFSLEDAEKSHIDIESEVKVYDVENLEPYDNFREDFSSAMQKEIEGLGSST